MDKYLVIYLSRFLWVELVLMIVAIISTLFWLLRVATIGYRIIWNYCLHNQCNRNRIYQRDPDLLSKKGIKVIFVATWIIFFIPTISLIIYYFWYYNDYTIKNIDFHDDLLETLQKDARDPAWANIQYSFKCCGVDNYTDYTYASGDVDDSCCKIVFPNCAKGALKNTTIAARLHQNGCLDSIRSRFVLNVKFVTFPFQIICLVTIFLLFLASLCMFK